MNSQKITIQDITALYMILTGIMIDRFIEESKQTQELKKEDGTTEIVNMPYPVIVTMASISSTIILSAGETVLHYNEVTKNEPNVSIELNNFIEQIMARVIKYTVSLVNNIEQQVAFHKDTLESIIEMIKVVTGNKEYNPNIDEMITASKKIKINKYAIPNTPITKSKNPKRILLLQALSLPILNALFKDTQTAFNELVNKNYVVNMEGIRSITRAVYSFTRPRKPSGAILGAYSRLIVDLQFNIYYKNSIGIDNEKALKDIRVYTDAISDFVDEKSDTDGGLHETLELKATDSLKDKLYESVLSEYNKIT